MTGLVVETDLGFVRGMVREGVSSFRGIPFASAPEGPLRFRLPAPPAAWDGVRAPGDGDADPPR